ncbi:MAG: ABC transporter permease [Bacteroidaceae bacterium]|nr:ABC transporter permease [Bacteroidaceae bacterium]
MKKKRQKNTNNSRSFQTITLCFSTSLVLILIGLVVLSVLTAKNLSNYVKENISITLYLNKDLTDSQGKSFANDIRKKTYVADVSFVSKEEISKEQTEELGADPTDFVGANPFSSEIDIHLSADYANNDSISWIQEQLKKDERVQEVDYQENLIEQVNKTVNKLNIGLLILAAILTVISFSLINNTVRLGVYARRFAIRTMKLVGASWSFIRWPFLKNALVIGFISSIVACVVLGSALYMLTTSEPDVLTVLTNEVFFITAAVIFLFGMLITFLCSYFSVNKFLNMKAGDLYKI